MPLSICEDTHADLEDIPKKGFVKICDAFFKR